MDWNTETTKSSFETDTVLSNYQQGRGRTDAGGSYDGYTLHSNLSASTDPGALISNAVKVFSGNAVAGYNLVGIKATEVENMRESIRQYVANVQKVMDQALSTNAEELNKAVRGGEVEKAVNEYVDKVKAYCQNVISGLLVFSDKLADVGNAWVAATQNMAGDVRSTTGAFAEGSQYTESVQYNAQ